MIDKDNLAFFVSDDHVSDPNFKTADGTSRSFADMPGEDDRERGSMIERVAQAVRDEIAHPHDGEFMVEGGFRGDDFFADIARAVLAVMREPTEAMDDAGSVAGTLFLMEGCAGTRCWQAMIDEALK